VSGIYYPEMLDVLRAAGCVCQENSTTNGWQKRARSSGGFPSPPLCVFWHHTASSTSPANDLSWQIVGCDDAPVGNLLIDRDGVCWPVAAGASNCAGKGGPASFSRGTIPQDSGNTRGWQIEVANNGVGEAWPQVQVDAFFAASTALNAHVGNQPTDVISHALGAGNGWTNRKIDPATAAAVQGPWKPRSCTSSGTWHLDDIRAECARRATTTPLVPEEDEVTDDDINRIAAAVWARLVSVPDKEPQSAQWVLGQTYVMTQRTVKASEQAASNTRT
jgi:N-acetylmuramoyl-L-alanine amidase